MTWSFGHHFQGQRSRSPGRFGRLFKSLHNLYGRHHNLRYRPERAAACRSWTFMAQGALGAAGVRRVWAGAGLQRAAYRGGGILRGFLTACLLWKSYSVQYTHAESAVKHQTTNQLTLQKATFLVSKLITGTCNLCLNVVRRWRRGASKEAKAEQRRKIKFRFFRLWTEDCYPPQRAQRQSQK